MELIAVTPPYFYPGEADAIAAALAGEFSRVHIRKPGSTAEQMELLLAALPAGIRSRISLHDHTELAVRYGIGGVHLNSRCPAAPYGFRGIISKSVHSPAEAVGHTYHYVLLSPVFPSISKPGYASPYTFSEMAAVASPSVYALGGVTFSKLQQLKDAGFGGAAMLTEAWRAHIYPDRFRLQFITHPTPRFDVVAGAKMALEGGCRWVQLRQKDADTSTLISEGKRLAELCRRYDATLIVDDHPHLVDKIGADGVHLGQNDMPVAEAREILGPKKIIGATANTFEMLAEAARAGADYAGVGPYRFTTTKTNLSPVLGLEGYTDIVEQCRRAGINIPIVAIGGITPDDIPAIMRTGVAGIAASSTILGAANPAAATAAIINTLTHT